MVRCQIRTNKQAVYHSLTAQLKQYPHLAKQMEPGGYDHIEKDYTIFFNLPNVAEKLKLFASVVENVPKAKLSSDGNTLTI